MPVAWRKVQGRQGVLLSKHDASKKRGNRKEEKDVIQWWDRKKTRVDPATLERVSNTTRGGE